MAGRKSPKPSPVSTLPSAAESREELRGRLARRYAFGVAFFASVLGYTAYQLTPGAALGVPAEVRGPAATAFGTLVFAITLLLGLIAFRRRAAEMERVRNLRAQLTIYRVGEALDRLDREEELVRCALDVIADGTGLAFWAIYRREEHGGAFRLTATRGLPAGAAAELEPDPIGPEAKAPSSRAAWLLETIVARDADAVPPYAFPAATEGLGPRPIVISVPLTDREEAMGVLQCFVPRRRGFEPDQLALVRWTASQLAVGLKRIRMERRDRMLASYLTSSGELVFVADGSGRVTDANAAAEQALGAAPGALRGRALSEFIEEEASGRPYARAAGGGSAGHARESAPERLALRLRRLDGRVFPCEATVVAIAHPETGEAAQLLVGRDVSERREREAASREQADELRALNGRLQQANARLGEAQLAQQQFLAHTSHELRTPLNGVIGFATLLEQGTAESEEEVRSFARSIRESAEHLLSVLNDILDLAKMEAGRMELQLVPGDARPVLRSAAESVAVVAGSKGLALRVELPEGSLPVVHDAARLRQVVLNVIGNAVKFTDQGEIVLRAWRDADRGEVCVVVSDTGIGIPRERQSQLFTRFSRTDGSYAKRRPGTGLGLAITKGLVERMGGAIAVESDGLNRGTRVKISFPSAMDATAAPARSAPAGREPEGVR